MRNHLHVRFRRPVFLKTFFAKFPPDSNPRPGNTTGGSITVPLTSCLTCLDEPVLQIKPKIVSCHTADSKPVKQKVNDTVILPPLVFPASTKVVFHGEEHVTVSIDF